jgi:predicted nucleic acid-binding protein
MSAAPVVSNASALIALEQIGQIGLLEQLFGRVLVPPAVVREVAPSFTLPAWIEVQALAQPVGPLILSASLGSGESEAISLALEVGAERVVLDDRAARRLAQALHLPIIGTLGLLLAAKRRNILPAVRPALDALLQHGFRIAPALYEQVIRDAHEEY